jgi:hypothetical protein
MRASAIGRKVAVIFSDRRYGGTGLPFPPVGAVGEIVTDLDEFGEYDVLFYDYPCNTLNDPTWITHQRMIVFIDGFGEKEKETEKELCIV